MIEIKNFEPDHVDQINKRDVFAGFDSLKKSIVMMIDTNTGAAKTITCDEGIVAIVGVNVMHKGVAECWSITSDLVEAYAISFHKIVLSLIKYVFDKLKLHRLQVTVRQDFAPGRKWVESLGFTLESVMGRYGPDKSHVCLYVRYS